MVSLVISIIVFPILLVLSIVIHELGHYFVCRFYKVSPMWVNLGSGQLLWKINIKGTWFHFKKFPFAGDVNIAPGHLKKMGLKGAIALFLAGPLAQLLFAILVTIIGSSIYTPMILQSAIQMSGTIILYSALMNLYPFQAKNPDGRGFRSDGFHIRNMWKRRHQFSVVNDNW